MGYYPKVVLQINIKYLLFDCANDFFGIHASFGVGAPVTSTVRPRFFGGLGISLGREHSIAIDAGLVMGNVERLCRAYSENGVYSVMPENVTISQLQTAGYISLGYLRRF